MMIDTTPLLASAGPVVVAALNALDPSSKNAVAASVADGGRLELRIAIVDGDTAIGLWLANMDGSSVELGRL